MAFSNVLIRTTLNGSTPINGYRADLSVGDTVGLSLTSTLGIATFRWELVGRPEGSAAGGAGPEPIVLSTTATASFVVDSDVPFRRDGTYVAECVVNAGTPTETRIRTLLVRLSGIHLADGRSLRKLGGFEALEDVSVTSVLQGWATMVNRWLEYVRAVGSGASTTTLAGAYAAGSLSSDQTLVLTDVDGGGVILDATGAFTGASALRINTTAGGPIVFTRATGRIGLGNAAPAQALHATGASPALRLERTGGAALDVQNVSDSLEFLNGATLLGKFLPTGGLQADFGVGVGTPPATAPVVSFGPGSTVPVSNSGEMRVRYNEVTFKPQYSANGGPWTNFSDALSLDGILTGSAQLASLNSASFSAGQVAWVNSVATIFILENATLTADNITVVAATGKAGYVWRRVDGVSGRWWERTTWHVKPSTGNDENDGAGSGTAIKTFAELARRLYLGVVPTAVTANVTVNLYEDAAASDYFTVINGANSVAGSAITVRLLGVPTVANSGVVAAVTTRNMATNTPFDITITGFNWAPHVGKIIRLQGTTDVSSVTAVVLKDLGTGKARITSTNVLTSAGTMFTVGQTVEVLTLPKIPGVVIGPNLDGAFIGLVDVSTSGAPLTNAGKGSVIFFSSHFGNSAFGHDHCGFASLSFFGCSVDTSTLTVTGGSGGGRVGVINGSIVTVAGSVGRNEWQDMALQGNSTFEVGEQMYVRFHETGVFDHPAAATAVHIRAFGTLLCTDFIFGAGNDVTASIATVDDGGTILSGGAPLFTTDCGVGFIVGPYNPARTVSVAQLPYGPDEYGNKLLASFDGGTGFSNNRYILQTAVTGVQGQSLGAIGNGYVKNTVSSGVGTLSTVATVAGSDVTLTATQVAFGSVSNTMTSSGQHTFVDGTVPTLKVGDGTTATNAHLLLNNTGTFANRIRYQQAGVTYIEIDGQRDGTATTGRVIMTTLIVPVSGGSNNDFWSIHRQGSLGDFFHAYIVKEDVSIGAPNLMAPSATNGFIFLSTISGPPVGVPERLGVLEGPRDRLPVVIDSGDKRFYSYIGGAWHYAEFNDGIVPYSQISGAPTIFYQTVKDSTGAAQTQRANLKFLARFAVADATPDTTVDLAATAVTPGSYTLANITVDAYGRITAASSGSSGTITAVTGTPPISSSGGSSPDISLNTNGVTDMFLRQGGALTVIGRSANSTGNVADIQATAASDAVLRESGSTIGWGTVATGGITNNAVTDAKLRQSAALSVIGRSANSGGNVADISAGADGDVLRRAGTTLGFGSIPVTSVSGAEVALTFSTGLTRNINVITANLSTGVGGGQTLVGGTGAGDNLTISTTSNGTKGKVLLGSSANFIDETQPASTSWFTLGNSGTSPTGAVAQINRNANGPAYFIVSNPNAGGAAEAAIILSQSATTYTNYMYMSQLSSGYTTTGPFIANAGAIEHVTSGSAHMFFSAFGSQDIDFYTTTSRNLRLKIATGGGVTVASLGTGLVKSTSGLLANASAADVAGAITWPAAHEVLVSTSTSTAPNGSSGFIYDTGTDTLTLDSAEVDLSGGTSLSLFNLGTTGSTDFEILHLFRSANVYTIKSQKGGTGAVRPITIDADTAILTLSGSTVSLSSGTTAVTSLSSGGTVFATSGGGALQVAAGPAALSHKWSIKYVDGSTGIQENFKTVVGMADHGFGATADGKVTAVGGTSVTTTLAATYGTANAVPIYRTAYLWVTGTLYVAWPLLSASGTGTGTLRVAIFAATDVTNIATYISVGNIDLTFSASTVASIGASTTILNTIPADAHLMAVAYRADNNSALSLLTMATTVSLELTRAAT